MKTTVYALTATAVEVVPKQHFERTVIIHVSNGNAYIGQSTITGSTDALHVPNSETLPVVVPINENVYAVAGGGSATMAIFDVSAD